MRPPTPRFLLIAEPRADSAGTPLQRACPSNGPENLTLIVPPMFDNHHEYPAGPIAGRATKPVNVHRECVAAAGEGMAILVPDDIAGPPVCFRRVWTGGTVNNLPEVEEVPVVQACHDAFPSRGGTMIDIRVRAALSSLRRTAWRYIESTMAALTAARTLLRFERACNLLAV